MSLPPGSRPPSTGERVGGPPYPPEYASLGGSPRIIPDVPISAVLLVFYIILGASHITILLTNKGRGHKFIFNGALLGLCKIRTITMSLRIAWSYYQSNIGLAIAANVFVYVGTIILYETNWLFTQRIVRSQHARFGWSKAYLILHRLAELCMLASLIMLVIASVWQYFTLDPEKLRIFRALQLTGQTYFTAFCFAPIIVVGLSLLFSRHEVEKFGAGRLRIKIIILIVAASILSFGQIFRCVLAWIPPTPIRNTQGEILALRWYHSKPVFYVLNFVTEIIVLILYAIFRIDLRFHIPNGSRRSGDYSGRNSRIIDNIVDGDGSLKQNYALPTLRTLSSGVNTPHSSSFIFDDSNTLTGSTLEVDKISRSKRTSTRSSISSPSGSQPSLSAFERTPFADSDIPPVPQIPSEWPLPVSPLPQQQITRAVEGSISRKPVPKRASDQHNHRQEDLDINAEIRNALVTLESLDKAHQDEIQSPPVDRTMSPAFTDGINSYQTSQSARKDALNTHKPPFRSLIHPHPSQDSEHATVQASPARNSTVGDLPTAYIQQGNVASRFSVDYTPQNDQDDQHVPHGRTSCSASVVPPSICSDITTNHEAAEPGVEILKFSCGPRSVVSSSSSRPSTFRPSIEDHDGKLRMQLATRS